MRRSITTLDRAALRAEARKHFGLDPDAPTLLVFGGSQGAASINNAISGAAKDFADAGIGVLHAHGPKNSLVVQEFPDKPAYVPVPYLERMDLAYAAADAVLCRSGAMTVGRGLRGRPARDLRAAAARQRRAGPQRASPRSTPGRRCWSRTRT